MSETTQSPAAAIAASNGQLIPAQWPRMLDQEWTGQTMVNNFDGDPRKRVRLLTQATGPKDLTSEELETRVFQMRYWAVHTVEMVDRKSGEVTKNLRVVLISPTGEVVAFVSQGVVQSLGFFVSELGPGPYDPPLPVRVKAGRTAANMRVLSLTLADDEPEQPAGGKSGRK